MKQKILFFYSNALSDARKSKLRLAGSCLTRVRTWAQIKVEEIKEEILGFKKNGETGWNNWKSHFACSVLYSLVLSLSFKKAMEKWTQPSNTTQFSKESQRAQP